MRGGWKAKALGVFLEFRLIPVLLWSYTAVVLGTAVAFFETGAFDLLWFAVAIALAGLIQGWVTHAINEIYDWRSGTDRHNTVRALSGGSKVLNLGLLDERDLWRVFAASSLATFALAAFVGVARAPGLVLLIVAGYVLGLAYTVPPLATAYRPFVGEWLGGFPGVLLGGVGAYMIQSLRFPGIAFMPLAAHACVCTAMLVMHHYLDADADHEAVPRKRTSVVALGPLGARAYATSLAGVGAALYAVAGFAHPGFFLAAALTIVAASIHARTEPRDLRSVTRNELRVIQLGIAAGLVPAVAIAPPLWPLVPLAALGYFAHLFAVAPPAELGRAWRRASKGVRDEQPLDDRGRAI